VSNSSGINSKLATLAGAAPAGGDTPAGPAASLGTNPNRRGIWLRWTLPAAVKRFMIISVLECVPEKAAAMTCSRFVFWLLLLSNALLY